MKTQLGAAKRRKDVWLILGRLAWVGLAAGYLAIWLSSLKGFYTQVSTLSIEPYRLGERVLFDNSLARQQSVERGISLRGTAIYDLGFEFIQILSYYFIAAVIFWRASGGYGWFTSFILMLMATTNMQTTINVARPFSGAFFLTELPGYFIWPFWMLWLYLFPNGRPVPAQTSRLAVGMLVAFLALQTVSILSVTGILPARIDAVVASLSPVGVLPLIGLVLYSQIYRFRRVSTLLERQQTKWFLFAVMLFFIVLLPFPLFPNFYQFAYAQDFLSLLFLIFPIAVAIAIFRYRLWEIDLLIRRTLVYSALTAILAVAYFGSVVLLQELFQIFFGQHQSTIAIVISTLGIAALFSPLRRRIQELIDRRFYRRKYDTEQVLARFAATARDEMDLQQLSGALLRVVEETIQPEETSLWLMEGALPAPPAQKSPLS